MHQKGVQLQLIPAVIFKHYYVPETLSPHTNICFSNMFYNDSTEHININFLDWTSCSLYRRLYFAGETARLLSAFALPLFTLRSIVFSDNWHPHKPVAWAKVDFLRGTPHFQRRPIEIVNQANGRGLGWRKRCFWPRAGAWDGWSKWQLELVIVKVCSVLSNYYLLCDWAMKTTLMVTAEICYHVGLLIDSSANSHTTLN